MVGGTPGAVGYGGSWLSHVLRPIRRAYLAARYALNLRWGSARYSTIVKPVLDAYEQHQQATREHHKQGSTPLPCFAFLTDRRHRARTGKERLLYAII